MKSMEETIRDAEIAAEPGTLVKGEVISKEDDAELPAQMTAMTVKSAGYVYVYDTKTGDRSLCNRNALVYMLKKKRPDGSFVFTTQKPKVEPKRGIFKCLLHRDDPNRARYDEMGLPVCPKDSLTSRFQVNRHMQKRHKMEWATIEEERKEKEKQEEREFRQTLMGKANPPLYVSKKDKEKMGITE